MHTRGDDVWQVLADELGGMPIPREIRAVLEREKSFRRAMDVWRAGDASAREKAMVLLRTVARPTLEAVRSSDAGQWRLRDTAPPAWWSAYSRAVFLLFREEQRLSLSLLGLGQPITVAEVEPAIQSRQATERMVGNELTLQYPVASKFVAAGMPVYDGAEETKNTEEVIAVEREFDAIFTPLMETLTPSERGEFIDRFVKTVRARAGDVDSRQNLARIADLQDKVARETGCEKWEATQFLLCDIACDLPFVRVEVLEDWALLRRPAGDGPVRIVIGSPKVPVSAVAAAYSALLEDYAPDATRSRTNRSASPLLAAGFVREYRQQIAASGRSPSWLEMWNAFRAKYPDAYGSLESFRQTVYRQLGPSRESGQ